ncbi:MAG: formylglycine-generating enzyme family protein [Phycisphaerales bacterium]|jgi:formylglycine-generating enzyme required for sulfatase activity|nr:formylglycine-generating enzyme family protein [Phycisphaerales bacterium]
MKQSTLAAIAASLFAAGVAHAQVTIEWVTVGNPGNAPDPLNSGDIPGIGSVGYEYRIGKYEVTNAQYAAFLNAVAKSDPHALYNGNMGSNARGGIARQGVLGSYVYTLRPNMGDKPVVYINWYDAARFCNWMSNGQPSGGGGTEEGVYVLVGREALGAITRDPSDANQVFIPTEGEWYKAAFHQPAAWGGDSDDYWLYATQSNSAPINATATSTGDVANPGSNVVNYDFGADWQIQNGMVTTVGSAGNTSFYGANDMNGNVWEWTETLVGSFNRGVRAGSWASSESDLRSSNRGEGSPPFETFVVGFRVASLVPPAPCPADWDNSGGEPNSSDFLAYLNDFSTQDPAADLAPPGNPPGDGVFDSSDFLAFLNLYAQGC